MFFWKKDNVELRMMEQEDHIILENYLRYTKSRIQSEKGVALPATAQAAIDMTEHAKTFEFWL